MLILASSSPRRRQLLQLAGLDFTVESSDVDESAQPGEAPATYVQRLALEKAQAVWEHHKAEQSQDLVVLGADTTVVCDGEILGKPIDPADARRMLRMLAGRTHQVLTGIAAVSLRGLFSEVEITQVYFDLIHEDELNQYIASGEPMDKAGAYGIQGYAARWIPRIEGCFFNVMGLPIACTMALLARAREGHSETQPPPSRLAVR
ncbi:Maf family protein [Edaphobacter albus]|uniref:Maf family protein n=1 Tax=Edaphobacter sp. 4G125 TaxID=2763071 RepID=UPI001644E0AF|nr:nucleoside triphosphate pyrophosphatase [Edaphobacter sp. 4G125]QNI36828.1 septum formation inhibitor Maf [Edaphobacter sp. 4G125]